MRKIRFFYFGLSFIVHCFSDIQLLWRKHEIGKTNMICSDMFTVIRENRVPLSKRSCCFSRLFLPDLPGSLSLAGIPVKSLKLYLLNTSFCDQSETCVHILFLINFFLDSSYDHQITRQEVDGQLFCSKSKGK